MKDISYKERKRESTKAFKCKCVDRQVDRSMDSLKWSPGEAMGGNSSAIIFKGFEGNTKEFEDFSIATKKKPLIFTNTRTKKQIHAVDVADNNKERNEGLKDKRN